VTDEATAVAAVSGGWPLADLIAVPRLDTEFCSAVVCDGYADFASAANALASVWTLLSAVCREPRPFVATLTLPRLLTEVLRLAASVQ
jgi:energy-converting hydrogenase Eha subunit C